jgi:DNA transposition AAA+ family ATPase
MDAVQNPFEPGAGRPPAALVGRDDSIGQWQTNLSRIEAGRSGRPVVLYGLRGVGKTVLLTRLAKEAEGRSWIVAQLEAGTGKSLRASLSEKLQGPLADRALPTAGQKLLRGIKTAASFFHVTYDASASTFTYGLDLSTIGGGGADTGHLEADLNKLVLDLAAAAAEQGRGLAILIDEAQDLTTDELVAVCVAAHLASQQGTAFLIALAGLPSLPRVLSEAKSYAERLFDFQEIERLSDDLARLALTEPCEQEGVTWNADAVDFVVAKTSGYPYFLQQYGQETWNEAEEDVLTLTDARVGAARAQLALDTGFFRSRWERATPSEKRYLRAMAYDGDDGSSAGEIADRLSTKTTSLGPSRANLIGKGLIYAPAHGRVAFTVPGMSDFINRQIED